MPTQFFAKNFWHLQTLDRVSSTLGNLKNTIQGIEETNKKYDDFKSEFARVMNAIASKIGETMVPAWKDEQPLLGKPVEGTVEQVCEVMKTKKNIVFLTGAGISVASGIPTYRGVAAGEKYQKNGVKYENEEVATAKFMKEHPDMFYERTYGFVDLANMKKPNIAHYAIGKLQKYFLTQERLTKFTLITQNIDNLHTQVYTELLNEHSGPTVSANSKKVVSSNPQTKSQKAADDGKSTHKRLSTFKGNKTVQKNSASVSSQNQAKGSASKETASNKIDAKPS